MRYILIDIESDYSKCGKCRFLKFGRCQLFTKSYGEDRAKECIKSDMTDYIKEVVMPSEMVTTVNDEG